MPAAPSSSQGVKPAHRTLTEAGNVKNDGNMEMKNIETNPPAIPLEEDVMQLARLGEVEAIRKLFDSGKFDIDYKDEEGITPLHWAAINNQYALCKYLLEEGANVNAKGGESVATPTMWAAQRCHYYVVNLMLEYGADPLLTDVQGYNLLHLATFDGNVFLLVLLLHQGIPVDIADPQGHTCLMWAAYKGYPACVDLYLRWGADVHLVDENGFTALHWSLVRGSQLCIQKLIEDGSDRFLETKTGKTPALIAEEMKTTRVWQRALEDTGYDDEGHSKVPRFPLVSKMLSQKTFASRFFFFWPFFTIWCLMMVLSHMVIFAGVPLAIFFGYTLQWVAQQAIQLSPPSMNHLHKTPYLAGVFAASFFWVGVGWVGIILPNTYYTNPFLNFAFALLYTSCAYFYVFCMMKDPGFVPKLGGISETKAVIDDLLSLWKFDDENFCTLCMVRRPLRSKHCKRCGRCVAKHDHHCPWINNCVGVNNHKPFVIYIISMEFGVLLFIWLTLAHLQNLPEPIYTKCNVLSEDICQIVLKDPYTILLMLWATLQLVWVTMLILVQMVQIARAQTTYESMRGHHTYRAAEVVTSTMVAGSTSMEGAQLTSAGAGPDPVGHHHGHRHKEGCFAQWKKLLGLDAFVATAQEGLDGTRRTRRRNPFSRGPLTNCKDFWCDSAPLFKERTTGAAMLDGDIIDYTRMYETPLRMKASPQERGGRYQSVQGDDNV